MVGLMQILTADWIFPPGEPALEGGALLMDGGRLVDLGDCEAMKAQAPDAEVLEHPGRALIPGLINCHTHLELASIDRIDATQGFVGWVRALLAKKECLTEEMIAEDAKAAAQKIMASGTAYVADIASSFATVQALEDAGVPSTVFREFLGLQPEAMGAFIEARDHFDAGKPEQKPADARGSVPVSGQAPAHARRDTPVSGQAPALDAGDTYLLGRHPAKPRVLPACHAPFSTSPELFRAIGEWAREHSIVTSVHLAESPDESEFIESGRGAFMDLIRDRGIDTGLAPKAGVSPVAYADRIGFLGPNVIVVHLVQATDEDLALVKARGAQPCLCPSSNLHLTGKLARVETMLELDMAPCLGTDSTASGESLNLFNEMAILMDAGVSPEDALAMGTRNGARALNLPEGVGAFVKGSKPTVLSLPVPAGDGDKLLESALRAGAKNEAEWVIPPVTGF